MNTNHRYTSKFSGSGKSFQIRLDARKKGLRVAHIPIYTSLTPSELVTRIHRALIPIAISSVNIDEVYQTYRKNKTKVEDIILKLVEGGISIFDAALVWVDRHTNVKTKHMAKIPDVALHFDLASSRNLGSLDVLLFEICWMGGIISSRTASHYVWDRERTAIFIECHGEPIPSAKLLETIVCEPSPQTFCADERSLTLGRVRWINDLKTLDLLFGEPGDPSVNTKTTTIPGFILKMGVKQLKKMLADFNVSVPKSIVNKSELQELLANTMLGHGSSDADSGKNQDTSLLKRVPS